MDGATIHFYFLNFTCPDFPSAVLIVNVIVAPGAIGVFASPFSEFSPPVPDIPGPLPLPLFDLP